MKWSLDHFPPEIVSPILRRLVAKYLGDESQLFENLYLSRGDIQKLLNAGMEIGGHGFTHRPLGKLYYYDQLNELSRCATTLRDLIGRRPLMLSYPSGDFTPITMRIAEHLGFSNAFTIQKCTVESSPGPLEIGRFDCISIPSPAELQ
jgi:peptidoglycan/xylan/chitin deacetylase (PgdA/CDA1 family)